MAGRILMNRRVATWIFNFASFDEGADLKFPRDSEVCIVLSASLNSPGFLGGPES